MKQTEHRTFKKGSLVMFIRGRTLQRWLQLRYGETSRKLFLCEAGVVVSEVFQADEGLWGWGEIGEGE